MFQESLDDQTTRGRSMKITEIMNIHQVFLSLYGNTLVRERDCNLATKGSSLCHFKMKWRGVVKGYQFYKFAEIHFHRQEIGDMEVMDDKVLGY